MRKVLASITLVCYLALSCGVVINFHYCMDRLASTQIYGSESKVCGKCGMHKDPNGCCQDETKVVRISDEQQPSVVSTDPAPRLVKEITLDFASSAILSPGSEREWQNHSPPLLADQPIYLQNRVFRI
ncbi:MAG TPA: hypothetical protein VEB63_06025 [Chitinophagaceae bacterium]|nr:hypothetical protein [Chitinophagaceae bacterium]